MSDEIKEILEDIKGIYYFKPLLDYITNLQQKNQTLQENNQAMQEEMARVWKENERLKKKLDCKERLTKIMPENTEFIILSKADYDRQENEIELALIDYKSKVEKAIEDIDNLIAGTYSNGYTSYMQSDCCSKRLEIIRKDLQEGKK